MEIKNVSIDSIRPYDGNAKLHTPEQIAQIKRSIQEFGFNDPIGIWHGEIVEGHGRYIAAKELGMTEVPVIVLDDLSDEQRKAYGLVHNKLTMLTGFNIQLLQKELDSIELFDMGEYGFSTEEIIESDLDEFFNGSDEVTERADAPKERVMFQIKPDEKKDALIEFLEGQGFEYEILQ